VDAGVDGAELEFREFFAAEYGRLRGLGYLLTSDWAQAEELAQDTLVRTYRAWPRVRRSQRPGAYARKVLVNRHRSLLRRAAVEARHLAGRRPEEAVQPDLGPDGLVLCRRCGACPPASGPCWSCATTRTCPRPRWRGCSACQSARSSR
jgi:DNA-directed RNA polymerase specialized sigma24 family protein